MKGSRTKRPPRFTLDPGSPYQHIEQARIELEYKGRQTGEQVMKIYEKRHSPIYFVLCEVPTLI
jgi:hypothetical protein